MKILHITQAGGGIKTYIENSLKGNQSESAEYYLICSSDYGVSDQFTQQFILDKLVREPNLISDIICFFQILKISRTIKPDLIHCHSAKGGIHGRLLGLVTRTKTIFTPNAFSFLGYEGLKRKLFLFIEKMTKFNSYVLGVAKSESDRAINEVGYKVDKVFYVNNFVEVPQLLERDYYTRNKIGMIGRLAYQKNPILFLQIAKAIHKSYPEYKFILLGAGFNDYLSQEVESYISKHNLKNVVIEPWSKYKNISDFYKSLDIFLLTSRFEGLSFSLLEAMSLGIPVVTTNVDGNKDVVINHVNGTISNSFEYLVDAIKTLISFTEERKNMGHSAYLYVKENNNINSAKIIFEYYTKILNR